MCDHVKLHVNFTTSGDDNIATLVENYFTNIFQSSLPSIEDMINAIRSIEQKMNEGLVEKFTEEEVTKLYLI